MREWVAAPFAVALGSDRAEQQLLLWPALSGAAILLNRVVERAASPPPALYVEHPITPRREHDCCQGRLRERNYRAPDAPIEFEYFGRSALTAIGSATRRIYWFEAPASRVRVHPRDAPSLDTVPVLRRV